MSTWGGMTVHVVEPGTEIDGPHGQKLTVTDDNAVMKSGAMYCTQTIWDGLKELSRDNSNHLGEDYGRKH